MRIKVLLALSVLAGALSVFSATPANACQAELPSTACVERDLCLIGGKLMPYC
jgi:hypothetical protein